MDPFDEHQYREAGRVNYEAYASRLGWYKDDQLVPRWEDPRLTEREKEAWRVAAHEVLQKAWKQARPGKHGRA